MKCDDEAVFCMLSRGSPEDDRGARSEKGRTGRGWEKPPSRRLKKFAKNEKSKSGSSAVWSEGMERVVVTNYVEQTVCMCVIV